MNEQHDAPDGDALVIHWELDHPPDRVWKALTDPARSVDLTRHRKRRI